MDGFHGMESRPFRYGKVLRYGQNGDTITMHLDLTLKRNKCGVLSFDIHAAGTNEEYTEKAVAAASTDNILYDDIPIDKVYHMALAVDESTVDKIALETNFTFS